MLKRFYKPALAGMLCAAAMAFLLPAAPAVSQLVQVPQSRAELSQSFSPLVKKASPAVVNVYGARRERERSLLDDPFFRELFGNRGVPQERLARSVGSGVIVAQNGTVVTNHHVIEGMTELKVSLADRREFDAEVLLRDPKSDLAVLRIKGSGPFPTIEIGDSDALQVGDLALAIGNPFGVGQTVTHGIISALARTHVDMADYQFFIQTDAAINPGNSGGALVDMQGRLIGINTAIYSKSGGSHGIGFAIPVNMVRVVVASAQSGGTQVKRPWYGARLQNVTADIAESLNMPRPAGALVASVVPNSPAAVSGLKPGDVITEVDGVAVDEPDGFGFRFATKTIGGNATITILRAGRKLELPTRLIVAPETPPRETVKLGGRTPFAGLTTVNISPAVAEELTMASAQEGVIISEVASGSPAQDFGFQKGDVILSLNGVKVTNTKVLDEQVRARNYGWRLSINRGGQVLNAVIGG